MAATDDNKGTIEDKTISVCITQKRQQQQPCYKVVSRGELKQKIKTTWENKNDAEEAYGKPCTIIKIPVTHLGKTYKFRYCKEINAIHLYEPLCLVFGEEFANHWLYNGQYGNNEGVEPPEMIDMVLKNMGEYRYRHHSNWNSEPERTDYYAFIQNYGTIFSKIKDHVMTPEKAKKRVAEIVKEFPLSNLETFKKVFEKECPVVQDELKSHLLLLFSEISAYFNPWRDQNNSSKRERPK